MKEISAYVLTKLHIIYTLIVSCRLVIGTFIFGRVSADPSAKTIDIGRFSIFKMKLIFFLRYLFRNQELFSTSFDNCVKTVSNKMVKQNYSASDFVLSIPTFEWGEISAQEFFKEYLKFGKPAVFRNVKSAALELWSNEYFRNNYSGEKVVVGDEEGMDSSKSIGDYLQDENNDYVQNTVDILKNNPELLEQLGLDRFSPYALNREDRQGYSGTGYFGSELFLGKSKNTGTSFHCAGGENLFFQVHGKKRWTIISPEYTWLMHPIFNKDMAFVGSDISRELLNKEEMLNKLYPVFKYAPRYVVDLEPGDVLFNPSWYWHQVDNLTDETISVAA